MSWFSKKDGKNYFATVSGGYVMHGSWTDADPRGLTSGHCSLETFLAGQFNDEIKRVLLFMIFVTFSLIMLL